MSERFVVLTDLAGEAVYIGVEWIQLVRPPYADEYKKVAVTVVEMGGRHIAVRESMEQVWDVLHGVSVSSG